MKLETPRHAAPADGQDRQALKPVVVYPPETLPAPDLTHYSRIRESAEHSQTILVPPRDARTFEVPAGSFFRITSVDGPQVGDLNLWHADNLAERFFTGKTRALHGTHLSTGDRMWSAFPYLRPLATIVDDSLDWYGFDAYGGSVHDVIGTRCDPYTNKLLSGDDYHYCCHSNLSRALADHVGFSAQEAEAHVHDVLNVFMCTGFDRATGQYFMKHTPARPGDYIEFFAEVPLLGALSACPGGPCDAEHSSDTAQCQPLQIDIYVSQNDTLAPWQSPKSNAYPRTHG